MSSLQESIRRNFKFNFTMNVLDGATFGFGWGFCSVGTVVTLFVARLTDSAILIGLIPAIHNVGWQLPQLFMANTIARLRKYKPLVLWMTIHERLPFVFLALIALFLATLGTKLALILTFIVLIWQGLGAGVTANAWQTMLAKIIPSEYIGTFFGAQGALANVMMSISAILAGLILEKVTHPLNFALTFALSLIGMSVSMIFLGLTREPVDHEKNIPVNLPSPLKGALKLMREDHNFTAFLVVRMLSQFALMGFAFFIVYGVRRFEMSALTAGFLTATLTITETVANVLMGWLGDRFGQRLMLIIGAISITASSLIAWAAPSIGWMYPAFILAGMAYTAYWVVGIAFTVKFGSEESRPTYIGLSNTLVAPFTILAPIIGGWIADRAGYQATFMISAVGGLVVAAVLVWFVRDPAQRLSGLPQAEA